MPDRCTDPTCVEHWPSPMPFLLPALEAATPAFEQAVGDAADRALQDAVWVVSFDHWGQDGSTIVAVCATEEAARKVIADEVTKLDYQIERWDITR